VKSGLFGQNPFISRYRLRGDALEDVARIRVGVRKKMFLVRIRAYKDELRMKSL